MISVAIAADVERPADLETRAVCGVRCEQTGTGWRGVGAGGLTVLVQTAGPRFVHVGVYGPNGHAVASGTGASIEDAEAECMTMLAFRIDAARQISEAFLGGTTVQALRETRGWL